MRPHAVVLLILLAIPLQADILTLRDGRRYRGRVIWEGKREIVFRIVVGPNSTVVRRFPRVRIKRIERIDTPPTTSQPKPEEKQHVPPAGDDFEQMLREASELVHDGEPAAGLRALRRIVTRAPPKTLETLERRVQTERGESLAQWMATLRLRVALRGHGGRLLDVRYATPYEAGALARLAERLHDDRLKHVYDGRTLAQWARVPDDYRTLGPEALPLETDARLAAAAIGVRLRFDPRLKTDRDQRSRLIDLRARLSRLSAHISGLTGFTSLRADPDTLPDPVRAFLRRQRESSATSRPTASAPTRRASPGNP